ncbi:MAG: Nif3-like dinuclear metal center hexameric protein [Clostridiaceae bacterium]|nr:Nif3-like dinuclear metal center hexameric protein [Clostridiaceae bacterium]
MSVKCGQIARYMNTIAPIDLAEEWDNVGLIIGDPEQDISKVLVCLDVTTDTVNFAIEQKVDMIISHHPLIFKPISRIVYNDWKQKLIYKLINNHISLFSAHTNLDYARSGVNWNLARVLNLENIKNAGNVKRMSSPGIHMEHEEFYSLAKTGMLKTPQKLIDFISHVKQSLNVEHIRLVGKADDIYNKVISKVMVFSGSFDDDILRYISPEIDAIVTGDIKHHSAIEMLERGICALDAGHFATENIIIHVLGGMLGERFPQLNVIGKTKTIQPFIIC